MAPRAPLRAVNRERGTVLAGRVEAAETVPARMRGWLGRAKAPADEGLWLAPCWAVHTFGMRFPIDLLFLDAEGRVVHAMEGLKPWRLSRLVVCAHGVLELPAGKVRSSRTAPGDTVAFVA